MVPVRDLLFDDRGWALKLAAAAVLFAGLCHAHRSAMLRLRPDAAAIDRPSPQDLGGVVRRWGVRVADVEAAGFRVEVDSGLLAVRTPGPPDVRPGDRVAFSARLAGARVVAAEEIAVIHGYAWKRPLNYVLSAAVLVFLLWRSRGLFRGRPAEGFVQGRC